MVAFFGIGKKKQIKREESPPFRYPAAEFFSFLETPTLKMVIVTKESEKQ